MIAPVQPWRWIRLQIGLAVNGGIQYALLVNHPSFWPALGLTSLLIAILLLWPVPVSTSLPSDTPNGPAGADYWRGYASHVYALLPLWAGHIALSREQIDEAAAHLTQRFDSMLRQLGHQPAQDDSPYPLSSAENRLNDTLNALQQPAALQRKLSDTLQQLRHSSLRLEALSQASGDAPLAEQVMEQSRLLAQQLQSLDQEIGASCHACHLGAPAGQTGFDLAATVEDVLTNLQFQDRVSQILSHVQNDIWQLEAALHEALHSEGELPSPPDTDAWLTALKNSYTTHEQRALHNRDGGDKAPGPSDITFF
ncbi:hypothetical protein DK842_12620 [Chromobacterium phragmitis]|uniref:Uncharacterized protein n=1 Tax=Chromobacterium phragmitis TaxID=2202141 RepID=A0A344UL93_9NEIS|nr:hypothetical protein [Chromobacterium phragmitis]AXE30670.1 hypothetical protein DK842_12620 [Chromobacterium phragmitis]AXE36041.1 hypothetical protein DK843_18050 [Chromobacterium phragmitis]